MSVEFKLDLFIALMQMTTSDNDGEALNAIRKANAVMKRANVTWDDLLRSLNGIKKQEPRRPPPRPEPKWDDDNINRPHFKRFNNEREINSLFSAAFGRNHNGSFETLLRDIHRQWNDRGYLTEKQFNVVRKAALQET